VNSPASDVLDDIVERLPALAAQHAPTDAAYRRLKARAIAAVAARFAGSGPAPFPPFGEIVFPYLRMGNIDSLDLFGLDELILFAFYWRNRRRYRRVADFGANIGLHSLVMRRCGFSVRAFEPDPTHLAALRKTLSRNRCENVAVYPVAISTAGGEHGFTRVLGNTTGSHLSGAKPSPYGELEQITVSCTPAAPHLAWADLVKMDIEGHEAEVLCAADPDVWRGTDAVVEIGSVENAQRIYNHFSTTPVNLFAQKVSWAPVRGLGDMPTSHRDGSLFISVKDAMPWAG